MADINQAAARKWKPGSGDGRKDAFFKLNSTLNPSPDFATNHTTDTQPDRYHGDHRRICKIKKTGSQLPRSLPLS
jgi:hypothetical protein